MHSSSVSKQSSSAHVERATMKSECFPRILSSRSHLQVLLHVLARMPVPLRTAVGCMLPAQVLVDRTGCADDRCLAELGPGALLEVSNVIGRGCAASLQAQRNTSVRRGLHPSGAVRQRRANKQLSHAGSPIPHQCLEPFQLNVPTFPNYDGVFGNRVCLSA